jgi:hypothetical protein
MALRRPRGPVVHRRQPHQTRLVVVQPVRRLAQSSCLHRTQASHRGRKPPQLAQRRPATELGMDLGQQRRHLAASTLPAKKPGHIVRMAMPAHRSGAIADPQSVVAQAIGELGILEGGVGKARLKPSGSRSSIDRATEMFEV